MIKVFTIMLLLGIVTTLNSATAQSGGGPIWVSGEVSSIFEDEEGAIFRLKLASGDHYNISATNEVLEGISVGDYVTVEVNKGWADLIEKGQVSSGATPKPDKDKTEPQWVAGYVVAINEGPEDSLISLKLSNDKVFNVSASNHIMSDIKAGDYITVKILKGWAQSITKK